MTSLDPSLTLYRGVPDARLLLVLAHGAGAGQRHPFIVSMASGLARAGVDVVTFDFPYVARGSRLPDPAPVLEASFAAVLAAVIADPSLLGRRVFIGGKSMGGRIATHLAAQRRHTLAGVVALGYPLHPPGKPHQRRDAHLPGIVDPVLIVQGERDVFGTASEIAAAAASMRAPVTLECVRGGDHSLGVRGRAAHAVLDEVVAVVAAWMTNVAALSP